VDSLILIVGEGKEE